ncbi:MAG: sigma-70 family RNA polymerase sigma factor, partial [Acidimicrobiaceae bacterium]|nr:sigma-70 family RNA polymerase sigma factor [Acidimicrobiaceae bacterium]
MAAPIRGQRDRRGWDDARLVEATRGGDQEAWAALYSRHLEYTRAVAARRTPDAASAEDAVAVGWASAFERLGTLRDPAKFRPWVAAAVGHAAVDEMRRTQRIVPSEDLTAVAGEDDPVAEAGVAAADRASRAIVARRAFLALPERHRKVLAMALVDDMAPKQIAAALDLDPNAVSQLLHRAKNGLRRSYVRARLPNSAPEQCRQAHELTIEYARGNESVRPEIAAHLAECDFCAARLTEVLSTRGGAWALFGAVPIALVALGSLPRKTLTILRTAFHSGLEGLQSGVQGVTSLPMPVAGGIAGGSVAVAAAVVTLGTGVVPLPGGNSSRPPAASASASQPAAATPGTQVPAGAPVSQGGPTGGNGGAGGGGQAGAGHVGGVSKAAHPTIPTVLTPAAAARLTTTTSSTTSTTAPAASTTAPGASTTAPGASTTVPAASTTVPAGS